jgi:beta-lactamase regulating signal transducer with metallopeptidase domain
MTVALSANTPVTSVDLMSCLFWAWCGGVCLFGMRAFGGWLMLQKLRRTAQEAISPALLECCRRLQQRIGINAMVRYAYSEIVDAPAVVGWFRPVVLIPLSAMTGLSTEQLEAIIAHELAHVRRYDALVNLFQIAVETVLFYHPAVWWVNRMIRAERENCCDDIAVSVCGNPSEYARALAMLSDTRPAWVMAANGGALKARVGRLLGMQKMTHGIPRAGLAVLAVMCASCVVLAAGVFKQDAPIAPPAPPPPPSVSSVPPVPPDPSVPSVPSVAPVAPEPPAPPDVEEPEDLARASREAVRGALRSGKLAVREAAREAYRSSRDLRDANDEPQKTEEHPSGVSYIDSLESAGLTKLSVDDLIALKIQGVTADYVRQIKAAGFEPTIHELIGLKIQGVSPEYIRDVRATGLKPNMHEIIGMKIQGVTPEFIRAMQSAGLGDLQIRDFMSAKIQGVTPEFITKVRSHGFKDLTLHQLIGLKMANVF